MIDYLGLDRVLREKHKDRKLGISWPTIAKFKKGESVSVSVLERICLDLDCDIGDICTIKKDRS